MLNNILNFFKKHLPIIIYIALFIIMATKVAGLRLLLDDNDHIFPALLGNYVDHFKGLIYGYGLWRPLAFIFFYIIYTAYLFSPAMVHLFLLGLHFISGYLIKKMFDKRLGENKSLLISLIYIVFPFFSEQYGWLASSNATVANLILILQIYIILSANLSRKTKLIFASILQIIGMFFYESLFFTFIPLAVLMFKSNLLEFGVFALPSFLYFILRNLVFTPHNSTTVRDLGLADFLSGKFIGAIYNNIVKLFNDLSFLFLGQGAFSLFWKNNFIEGARNIFQTPVALLFLNYFFLLVICYLVLNKSENAGNEINESPLVKPNLWLQLSFFSLLPSLLLVQPSFPFRVIVLPIFFLLIALVLVFIQKFPKYSIIFMLTLFTIFLIISMQMIQEMTFQSQDDEKLFTQIVTELDSRYEEGQQTQVVIRNFPYSTRSNFNYGEYLLSCLTYDWCLYPALSRRTNKVDSIVINPDEAFIPNEISISLIYNQSENKFSSQ